MHQTTGVHRFTQGDSSPFPCINDQQCSGYPSIDGLAVNSVLVTRLLMDWLVFQTFWPHKREKKNTQKREGGNRITQKNRQQDNPKGLSLANG
jgi:hypothetical protein